ncbi:MAG: tetratricopeptide repeat protein [Myxococcota bacterium]|nr:tetratricopeptide repeat protein [Myxococcota bacterium]
MKRIAGLALWIGLLLVGPIALAGPSDSDVETEEDLEEQTMTGRRIAPVDLGSQTGEQPEGTLLTADELEEARNRAYPARVYRGAKVLQMEVEFVGRVWQAVEAIYLRDYKKANTDFMSIARDYKGSGVGAAGRALVWQALMMENFDFRYEDQYRLSFKQAKRELEESLLSPGNEGWEEFVMGGILGVDSIHSMRRGEYLSAFSKAVEALKRVRRSRELLPDFKDALVGDGMYNYWRTVVAMQSRLLPDLGDDRALGISQLLESEREAIFLGPAITLGLTFTWMEEGDMKRALGSALKNRQRYPDNVINNLVVGRIYLYMRKYEASEKSYLKVLSVDPANRQVHYYLTTLYLRRRAFEKAEEHVNLYLAFNDLSDSYRAAALFKKGEIYYRQKDYAGAEPLYREAWRVDRLKRAKMRLDRIKELEKG